MKAKTFTPQEKEIILDRLGQPQAIADVLTDEPAHYVSSLNDPFEYICARVAFIEERLKKHETVRWLEPLTEAILKDAVDGSIFEEGLNDAQACKEISAAKARAYRKAHQSLKSWSDKNLSY